MKGSDSMKLKKLLIALSIIAASFLSGCGKDYCRYGGCMREAVSGGRCSKHQGLENNPYYGLPDKWK